MAIGAGGRRIWTSWVRKRFPRVEPLKHRDLLLESLERRELLTAGPEISVTEAGQYDVYDGSSRIGFGSTPLGSPVEKRSGSKTAAMPT